MLIFLLLFSMLRSLQGAPAAPTSSFASAGDTLSLIARGDPPTPAGDAENIRTRFSIVQSCLLTIFACVWTAIHPNINGPMDSWWTCFKRKVTTTLMALIAPELILLWALNQRISAKDTADKYNAEFVQSSEGSKSLWERCLDCFRQLPWSTTHRGDGHPWTITHGFFLQMGGFLLYGKDGYPTEVLSYKRLSELIRENLVDQPTVTERELQDRSKGNVISKGIVVWQTMWFALQCCARLARRLPLSELEVVTLAFTVVNVAIYAAWWDKPQSVDTSIRLQLKEPQLVSSTKWQKPVDEPRSEVRPSTADSDDVLPDISDTQPLVPEDKPDEKESWFRRKLTKDRQNHGLPIFLLFRLPYRIAGSVLHLAKKVGDEDGFDGKRLRVPMFYAEENSSATAIYSLAVIGLIFGGIHFIAWASEFPSRLDQVLWRCASIALVAFPSFAFLGVISTGVDGKLRHFKSKVVKMTISVLFNVILVPGLFFSLLLYIPARLVVIILALKAIRDPSPAILQDVSWTSFIPHL